MTAEAVQIQSKKMQLGESVIKGKLMESNRFEGKKGPIFETIIVMPAADAYSYPNKLQVKSRVQIGRVQEDVTVTVRLQGRSYKGGNGQNRFSVELWMVE